MKHKLFGEVAVEKGYVDLNQIKQALHEQDRLVKEDRAYRFVGEILVEMGHMNDKQVLDVLTTVHEHDATT